MVTLGASKGVQRLFFWGRKQQPIREPHPTGLMRESLAAQVLDFMAGRRLGLLGLAAAADVVAAYCRYDDWCAGLKSAGLGEGWIQLLDRDEAIQEKCKAAKAAYRAGGSLEALCDELAGVTLLLNDRSIKDLQPAACR